MKRKSPLLLPAFCALLALGVGAAAWNFSSKPPPADASETLAPERTSETAQVSVAPTVLEPAERERAPAAAATRKTEERVLVATPAELELADALWVSGRVVFPEGTPIGETVEVVASGKKFKHRPPHRAPALPDGSFRVAFAAGTKSGTLDVDAAHLYLSRQFDVKPGDPKRTEEIVLEPAVGGALRGQLILPAGASGAELVGDLVHAQGWSEDFDVDAERSARVDENLRFELRGMPAKCTYDLSLDSDAFVTVTLEDLPVRAGETVTQDIELSSGARVRGQVADASGKLPETCALYVATQSESEDGDDGEELVELDEQGRFDARGIAPGKVRIWATGKQRVPAELDLGELAEGELRENVELVLQLGSKIGGRVTWPDGTRAALARVVLQRHFESNDFSAREDSSFTTDVANSRTNAQGEFLISGLVPAKYSLSAQAKPEAGPTLTRGSKGKQQAWRASLADVAIDTLDVELKLAAGYSLGGIVVDDLGAPVKRFSVSASPSEGDYQHRSQVIGSAYASADGRFELSGLQEEVYEIEVRASGYDDPEQRVLSVPDPASTLTFVATRRANLSGVVVKPDGTPAPRAEVTVAAENGSSGSESAVANSRGEFSVKSAPHGELSVHARLDDFATSEVLNVVAAPGDALRDLRLQLRRGATITGEVHALSAGEALGGRLVHSRGQTVSAMTDASGHFVLEHVDPGMLELTLQASTEQVDALSGTDDSDWSLIHDLERHVVVTAIDGVTTHAVFAAPSRASVALTGSVRRGKEPAVAVRVRVEVAGESESGPRFALSDANGHYEVALDGPGKYRVLAQPGGSDATSVGHVVEVPASGLHGVDLALGSASVSGNVIGREGAEMRVVNVSLLYHGGQGIEVAAKNEVGYGEEFEFHHLPAGRYTLSVNARERVANPKPSREQPAEDVDLGTARREIVLGEGEELEGLEIELRAAGALTIRVQREDGSSTDDGWIELARVDGAANRDFFYGGVLEATKLEIGSYEVRAGTDELVSASARVEVLEGQAATAKLVLKAGGRLRFDVRDGRGESVAATVQVVDSRDRPRSARPVASSESAGPYEPGECTVVATDAAGRSARVVANVVAGETKLVQLTLD